MKTYRLTEQEIEELVKDMLHECNTSGDRHEENEAEILRNYEELEESDMICIIEYDIERYFGASYFDDDERRFLPLEDDENYIVIKDGYWVDEDGKQYSIHKEDWKEIEKALCHECDGVNYRNWQKLISERE